jgi:hypothetical protein
MPYGVRMELAGTTREQYDAMHARFAPLADTTPGFVLHAAGPTAAGWYILEVWESKADHERFVREHVAPAMPPGGPRPSVQEFEVYGVQIAGQPQTEGRQAR